MAEASLTVSSKNYSSWSLRGFLLCRMAGLDFAEKIAPIDDPATRAELLLLSPSFLVPCLEHGKVKVWDTLAIAEYLAERFTAHPLWPRGARERARARSLCAEMHSGFSALRVACPQNIEASLPEVGRRVLQEQPAVRSDLERLQTMWREALRASGGPFLFGEFGIADAYFAPVAGRMRTYALPLDAPVQGYAERLFASPGVAAWVRDALNERDFLGFEEPYRTSRD